MKQLHRIIFLFLISGILYCEEAIDKEALSDGDDLLVVEGRLTNELKRHEIKLSQTFTNVNDGPPPVTDALVAINDGDTTHFLTHDPDQPGTYLTDSMRALFGKVYTLYINLNGQEYYARASSAFGTPLPDLKYQPVNDGLYQYLYEDSINSMTEVRITWEETDSLGNVQERLVNTFYYTLNVIDVNAILAPEKEEILFPPGATIFRRKYSLSEDHQNFLRSYLSEVDWRGGPFDVAPGNVLTNLSEGAAGYFSVSMVDTDTTLVR